MKLCGQYRYQVTLNVCAQNEAARAVTNSCSSPVETHPPKSLTFNFNLSISDIRPLHRKNKRFSLRFFTFRLSSSLSCRFCTNFYTVITFFAISFNSRSRVRSLHSQQIDNFFVSRRSLISGLAALEWTYDQVLCQFRFAKKIFRRRYENVEYCCCCIFQTFSFIFFSLLNYLSNLRQWFIFGWPTSSSNTKRTILSMALSCTQRNNMKNIWAKDERNICWRQNHL